MESNHSSACAGQKTSSGSSEGQEGSSSNVDSSTPVTSVAAKQQRPGQEVLTGLADSSYEEDSVSRATSSEEEEEQESSKEDPEDTGSPPPAKRSRVQDVEYASTNEDVAVAAASRTGERLSGPQASAAFMGNTRRSSRLSSRRVATAASSCPQQDDLSSVSASDGGSIEGADREELAKRAKYPLETKVCKYFPSFGYFVGTVVEHFVDKRTGILQHRVVYSDGDNEDYDTQEMDLLVLPRRLEPDDNTSKIPFPTPVLSRKDSLSLWKSVGNPNLAEWNGPEAAVDLEEQFELNKVKGLRSFSKNIKGNIGDFCLYVYERQCVWVRRQRADCKPWSANPILSDFKFCNNYRELDRGTALFRAHILELSDELRRQHNDASWSEENSRVEWIEQVLWASYMYRRSNLVESFTTKDGLPDIPGPSTADVKNLFKKMNECQGITAFFTHVHQTTNYSHYQRDTRRVLQGRPKNREEKLDKSLLHQVAKTLRAHDGDGEACFGAVTELPGVGPFLGWQILCDLKESRAVDFDDNSFCQLGPGAIDGLELIFGKQNITRRGALQLAELLVQHQQQVFEALNVEFPYLRPDRPLTLKEIEHALCEYSRFKQYQGIVSKTSGHPTSEGLSGSFIRKFKSRENLEAVKPCQRCRAKGIETGNICDSCLLFTCGHCQEEEQCQPADDDLVWICHRCQYFDRTDHPMLTPCREPHCGVHEDKAGSDDKAKSDTSNNAGSDTDDNTAGSLGVGITAGRNDNNETGRDSSRLIVSLPGGQSSFQGVVYNTYEDACAAKRESNSRYMDDIGLAAAVNAFCN